MRKIQIDKINFPDKSSPRLKDKLYSVYLNGNIEYFGSEKNAKAYLAESNKKLNEILLELNELYINTFNQYRLIAFYLKDNRIPVFIAGIEKTFHLVVTRSGFTNGNHFTFKHLENITVMLLQILFILKKVNYEKKYFPSVAFVSSLIKRIQELQELINNKNI
jgi:hypothetical protein